MNVTICHKILLLWTIFFFTVLRICWTYLENNPQFSSAKQVTRFLEQMFFQIFLKYSRSILDMLCWNFPQDCSGLLNVRTLEPSSRDLLTDLNETYPWSKQFGMWNKYFGVPWFLQRSLLILMQSLWQFYSWKWIYAK